nr:MAG TPA: hypothetical protein [Caudoviricetes sp.]
MAANGRTNGIGTCARSPTRSWRRSAQRGTRCV